MATVYSVQKTKWDQDSPKTKIIPSEHAGRVRVSYALYEAASLAADSVIEMFNLPNDARVLSGELVHDALGGSTTLSVGHGDGIPITVVIAGAAGTGTIELTMKWVLD